MNIAKNMEAIFIAAIALSCVTAFAASSTPATSSAAAVSAAVSATAPVLDVQNENMVTVVITRKRLTDAQKAQLGS